MAGSSDGEVAFGGSSLGGAGPERRPAAPPPPARPVPAGAGALTGFAALRAQARRIREELGDQPLAIANHDLRLIQGLLGG